MPSELLDSLTELATRAAIAAGEELVRRYGNVEGLNTKSTATDPVSDADRASERCWSTCCWPSGPTTGWSARRARPGIRPAVSPG